MKPIWNVFWNRFRSQLRKFSGDWMSMNAIAGSFGTSLGESNACQGVGKCDATLTALHCNKPLMRGPRKKRIRWSFEPPRSSKNPLEEAEVVEIVAEVAAHQVTLARAMAGQSVVVQGPVQEAPVQEAPEDSEEASVDRAAMVPDKDLSPHRIEVSPHRNQIKLDALDRYYVTAGFTGRFAAAFSVAFEAAADSLGRYRFGNPLRQRALWYR